MDKTITRQFSLAVVSGTYPPDIGGSELSIHAMCKGLISRGHKVTVIADDRRPKEQLYDGVKVVGCPSNQIENELAVQHANNNFDVVLTQLIFSPEALLWSKKENLPSVYFIRNNEMKIDLSISSKHSPTKLIANSKFTARNAKARWKRSTHVIYPFCNLQETIPLTRNPKYITMINPFPLKGGRILYQLAEEMQHRLFLVAIGWTGLRRKDGTWHPRQWNLISKAHADTSVRPPEEIDFSVLPNVKIVKGENDMQKIYQKTKILIFPSQWKEAFGRSVLEALAAGIPVIATNVGGILETGLSNGGQLLDKKAPIESWINAIKGLDNQKEYKKKAYQARKDVAWYSLENQLSKLEKVLLRIVKRAE